VAAIIALAGAVVVLRWMPGLGSTAQSAEPVTAEPVTAEPVTAEPVAAGRAALQPAVLGAAEAPRIDPVEALDAWQENLTAGAAPEAGCDPADEYLVDMWPGDFADRSPGVER
jgi:hypothetical protein